MSNNLNKVQIIKMLALKRHFMKWGGNVLEGGKHQNNYLFSFSTNRFQLFFVSKMSAEKSFVEKLQKLTKEQERLKEQ
jgi:hypothetical protein